MSTPEDETRGMSELEKMLPGKRVKVARPTIDHHTYWKDAGRITDIRDFGERRFCTVELEQNKTSLIFESIELTILPDQSI